MRACVVTTMFLALLMSACTRAPESHSILGHYFMRVTARDGPPFRIIVGDWKTEYRADGHLIVQQIGGWNIESLYHLDGDILTLTDIGGSGSCRQMGVDAGSARYRVHYIDSGIQFEPLRDECSGRRIGMTVHALQRIY